MTRRMLTVEQFAQVWQLTEPAVRRLIRKRRIPGAVNIGTKNRHVYRIPADAAPSPEPEPAGKRAAA